MLKIYVLFWAFNRRDGALDEKKKSSFIFCYFFSFTLTTVSVPATVDAFIFSQQKDVVCDFILLLAVFLTSLFGLTIVESSLVSAVLVGLEYLRFNFPGRPQRSYQCETNVIKSRKYKSNPLSVKSNSLTALDTQQRGQNFCVRGKGKYDSIKQQVSA